MATVATDTQRLSNLIKWMDSDLLEAYTEVVTSNEAGATTYPVGTVLGKITASGKYIRSVRTAVDGSQTAAAVVIADGFGKYDTVTIPATTDTKVLVLARGKVILGKEALSLDASYDTTPRKQAAYDALKALGLLVETQV